MDVMNRDLVGMRGIPAFPPLKRRQEAILTPTGNDAVGYNNKNMRSPKEKYFCDFFYLIFFLACVEIS